MKLHVRVRQKLDAPVLKRKVEKDGKTVIVYKSKGKKEPGWKFKITDGSVQPKKTLFGTKLFVDIYPDADSPIVFNHDNKTIDEPRWDKKQSWKFIIAKILEKMGQEPKEKTSIALWIIAGLVMVSIILPFITGRM
jgi:hypothetical protein